MKKSFQTLILISLSMLTLLIIGSCESMSDTYRQFVGDGETIYIGKADSVQVGGGNYRAEVSFLLMSDPKVNSYKLYWNNRQDSITNPIIRTDGIDTIRVMINNLSEGTHHFEIVTYDKYGNSSVPSFASGRVYGDLYIASLLNSNRIVRSMDRNDRELILNWMEAAESLEGVELHYVNIQGETEVHFIPSLIDIHVLSEFPNNGTYKHRSYFVPNPLAIDTFYTEFETTQVDDRFLRSKQIEFTTRTQYGAQNDQLSVLISQDFDGIYEPENINAATWIDVTNEFPLATENTRITWGPKDVTDLVWDGPIYVAFKYEFDPDKAGGQRTWRVDNFGVQTLDGSVTINQTQANFQLIHETAFEAGRSSVTSTLIQLRGNTASGDPSYKIDWAISGPLR